MKRLAGQVRDWSSTRYDRVCVNHELLARVLVARIEHDGLQKVPSGVGRTVYPDGTVKRYVQD